MTGLNGDNKVNDFTQVSNSASARSGAGFRGVRFYISLKPLESLNNHKVGRPDIHIGFKQRIPILHHSGKVQKKVILHRSQTRSNSRVSTFVLEVFDFVQVSNKTSVNRELCTVRRYLILHKNQTLFFADQNTTSVRRYLILHKNQTARTAATLPVRVWRHLILHRSQTGKWSCSADRMFWRCAILHRSQTMNYRQRNQQRF